MKRVPIIDSCGLFVDSLAHQLELFGVRVALAPHGALAIDDVLRGEPEAVIVSSRLVDTSDSGISPAWIRDLARRVPMLGIGWGHRCIAEA